MASKSTDSSSETRVGVDVGGTNTDVILVTEDDEFTFKTPSTADPSQSTLTGIVEVCQLAGIEPADVDQILHGTTVATNALIEHEGAKTGLLTTDGFRDVLHIGRHRKPHSFSLQQTVSWQEQPVVKRRHRKEISERIFPPGDVITPLDEDAVLEQTGDLVADGVESIAVCYLHSYLNREHEDRTKELIHEKFPDVSVSTSSEVVAQFREFERFTTTAINARLEPVMSTYLTRLSDGLTDEGFDAEVLIMQSNGGMASVQNVAEQPVTTLVSGPAAGVLSAAFEGENVDEPNLVMLDMGGTSADISVIPGRVLERDPRDSTVGGYPTITPMLDIETIGAGGGSIAWFDDAMGFNVGPKSAGANPGPACYARGNDQPTTTDAQVVLGRIDPDSFLGGDLDLEPERSREALQTQLCDRTDQAQFETPEQAALATLEVANTNMYRAIREQTVQRGYDPREYTMVAFGGAGPMHGASIAEKLEVSTVLVPPSPGIASARGLLTGNVKYDYQQTISSPLEEVDGEFIEDTFERLEARGREQLERDEIDPSRWTFRSSVDCLYDGQGYELNIDFDGTDGDWHARLRERFEERHEAEYGHYFEADPVELLNVRVTAIGDVESYAPPEIAADGALEAAKTTESTVVFGTPDAPEEQTVPRYERAKLAAGTEIDGPAIIDEFDSTVVVNPDWTATVEANGSIILTTEER
ncbi:hydantoinase/oxoprolinase family protein [Natronorubrum aibiense]|uniref:Hydantoinase/oxoprolinase family protein n=1 Tax=Natronorubrum aibiense TaxID=348826 RepID=A0A5P9P0Z7_9EURY|nr:hydantoinase/oxoprolinase family protein [Natronorubrum aibiense]QFU81804.1 hydantoinase/oxoprolinase family protein [Natronorubrum aibiense]